MSIERTERVRQIIIGRYADWIKRFDVSEYVQNPPMIEKLYEEKQLALVTSADLESQVKDLELRLHKLELENQGLRLRIDEVNKKSYFVFFLSLLATILVGIGVNIVTSSPDNWTGWIMIIAAIIIEIIAFLSKPNERN